MIKVEFGFGFGLDRDGKKVFLPEKGLETICNCVLRLFGGYTRYVTQGGWRDLSDGKVFIECGSTVVVFVNPDSSDVDERISWVVDVIKSALHQRAVYVVKTKVECDLM